MIASSLLTAVVDEKGGTIVLQGKRNNEIIIVGANVPISMLAHNSGGSASFVTIKPVDRKDGVVAVVVFDSEKNRNSHYYFLSVGYKESKPFINLDDSWTSKGGRVGQIIYNYRYHLIVTTEKFSYSSNPKESDSEYRHIQDPNILIKYLAGDIDEDEVEKAAEKVEEEISAVKQLEKSELKVKELEKKVAGLFENGTNFARMLDDERGNVNRWKNVAFDLKDAFKFSFFWIERLKNIRRILNNFPKESISV